MTETVAAFERHLLDNLDDRAAWSAYADYLTERGEPRGDFMRVQLALEDESLPKAERRALHEEEEALRVKHLDEWVGASFAAEHFGAGGHPKDGRHRFTFCRGFVWDAAEFNIEDLWPAEELVSWRWLYSLDLGYCELSLGETPLSRNLRSLQVGVSELDSSPVYLEDPSEFVAAATRLERLYLACRQADTSVLFKLPLADLRELHIHCAEHYATDALGKNPAFAGLHTVAFHPHAFCRDENADVYEGTFLCAGHMRHIVNSPHLKRLENLQLNCCDAGDAGIDLLVNSGLIHRLKSLDLRHGCVTDAGALALVKALDGTPHALKSLKLGDNALSGDGVAALRRLKLTLDAPDQHDPGDDNYLTRGDFE